MVCNCISKFHIFLYIWDTGNTSCKSARNLPAWCIYWWVSETCFLFPARLLKRFSYFLWSMLYRNWVWRVWEHLIATLLTWMYTWQSQFQTACGSYTWQSQFQTACGSYTCIIEAQASSVNGFWYRVSLIPMISWE